MLQHTSASTKVYFRKESLRRKNEEDPISKREKDLW